MELIETSTIIGNILLSGAAVTGAIVAVKGLNTWNRQLKGQHEYELSRRILVSLFKFRDVIFAVREPAIWLHEMESPPEGQQNSQEYIQYYGVPKVYKARWKQVHSKKTVLYTDLLEAEAIWGSELRKPFKKIFDLEHELFNCVDSYLQLLNPDITEESKEVIQSLRREKRDIMYDQCSDELDDFTSEFFSAIEEAEQYLKPKLKH